MFQPKIRPFNKALKMPAKGAGRTAARGRRLARRYESEFPMISSHPV